MADLTGPGFGEPPDLDRWAALTMPDLISLDV